VDPARAARVLGVSQSGGNFSEKVVYVYRKQLEEAEILVVNKVDTIDAAARQALAAALRREFPKAEVMEVSCTTGEGLDALFERLVGGDLGKGSSMDVDYDVYADGEALLGWLNARVELSSGREFDGNALLMKVARGLRDRLAGQRVEIAHLKLMLVPDQGPDVGSISLTTTAAEPVATHTLKEGVTRGSLLVNLRAETDPEWLKGQVTAAVAGMTEPKGELRELAAFRPGRPAPTHRMATATTA
jgi:hypothetical protein